MKIMLIELPPIRNTFEVFAAGLYAAGITPTAADGVLLLVCVSAAKAEIVTDLPTFDRYKVPLTDPEPEEESTTDSDISRLTNPL